MSEDEKTIGLEILEKIINKFGKDFDENAEKIKIGDFLKVIELKEKLSVTGTAERIFWKMINELRQEKLAAGPKQPKLPPDAKRKTVRRKKTIPDNPEVGAGKV